MTKLNLKTPKPSRIPLWVLAMSLAAPGFLTAQQTTTPTATPLTVDTPSTAEYVYDVASIRLSKLDGGSFMVMVKQTKDGLTGLHSPLIEYISDAYGKSFYEVSGGPDWAKSDFYDITAKMDESTMESLGKMDPTQSKLTQNRMLQTLLVDRFKLRFHHESRLLPMYALVVAKSGSKLHPSLPVVPPAEVNKGSQDHSRRNRITSRSNGIEYSVEGEPAPLDMLADQLSGSMSSRVENKTGLTGDYDFKLHYAIPNALSAPDDASLPNSPTPSIYDALKEQLGLKLELSKGPVDVIVIDHAERPSAN